MAIRMLADAKRHDSSSLGKELSENEIKEAENKLLQNHHFQEFVDDISKYGKAFEKVKANIFEGHGGRVEDAFRNYLRDLPAGRLDYTDPTLQHFMPTAAQRIEALQTKVKENRKQNRSISSETAEIVALRKNVHAEKGKKSTLQKTIPVSENIKKDMETLERDIAFCMSTSNNKVYDAIVHGHGGGITEQVLKAQDDVRVRMGYVNSEAKEGNKLDTGYSAETGRILKSGTRESRMRELMAECVKNTKKMETASEEEMPALIQESKEIMAEYQIHHNAVYDKNFRLKSNWRQKLQEDVPWSDVQSQMNKLLKSPEYQKMDVKPEQATEGLNEIVSRSQSLISMAEQLDVKNPPQKKDEQGLQAPEI